MRPEITFFRVRTAQIGYGRMGTYIANEMMDQGITVYDEIAGTKHNYVLDVPEAYKAFGDRPVEGLSNVVAWASVPAHARGWWEGQTPVLLTMFETDHLPTAFRENLHEFDTIIVPSKQNLELFSRYHPNVKYVPLGVDTERWTYVPRTMPTTRFNFLVAGRGMRKGTDLAYSAFRKVFPEGSWGDGPVPYLIMKSPKAEEFYGNRIETMNGFLSAQAERDLYASAHCYVGPSRGEGFGLQPLQAIIQGCPTILTNAHGHEAFAHLGMGLGSTMEKAGYFVYGDAGDWWEPDFDELCDTMRWVYDNYAEAVEHAAKNAPIAAAEFTWKNTTNGFLDAIGRERLVPFNNGAPLRWHTPTGKLYKVVLNCNHTADIGGTIMAFLEGKEYRVTADVKRILFDAGKVDVEKSATWLEVGTEGKPVWDAGDDGLLPEQVAQLDEVWQRQQFCPTCHQRIGSGEQELDGILAGFDATDGEIDRGEWYKRFHPAANELRTTL